MFDDKNHDYVHLSDLDILLEADGEVSSARTQQIRKHLATCWSCRTRKADLERAVARFVHLYRQQGESQIPPIEDSRRTLRTRLAEARHESRQSNWKRSYFTMHFALRAGACVLAAFLLVLFFSLRKPSVMLDGRRTSIPIVPEAKATSRAAFPVSREYVCRMKSVAANPIEDTVARQVFQRYGLANPVPGFYEIDYLIPPALGGSQSLDNLWPQPYSQGEWNSHVKDALEERLESLVCTGTLDIRQAQDELANDWVEAYKRYFHVEKPLLNHVAFVKDRPWPSPGGRPL